MSDSATVGVSHLFNSPNCNKIIIINWWEGHFFKTFYARVSGGVKKLLQGFWSNAKIAWEEKS
jgi:hypothetical protein